jgi:hypothetical protein
MNFSNTTPGAEVQNENQQRPERMSEPKATRDLRCRYALSEFLVASNFAEQQSTEDREWLAAPPVGDELV